MLRKIWSLARLVIIDGLRRHALLGLVVLAIAFEAGGLLFFDLIPRDVGRASADFILSIGWLTGFLFLLFHAVQVMAWDEGRRIIHTLLARPISRTQYVLGHYLGLATLLLALNGILGVLGYGVLDLVKNSLAPVYFPHLSLLHYSLSWAGLFCIELMVLAVIVLFSGLVRGGFPVLLITVAYYFICTGLPVVRNAYVGKLENDPLHLALILQWMTAIFPDFSRFDFKELITTEMSGVFLQYLSTNILLLTTYLTVTLWLASIVYQRRDLQ